MGREERCMRIILALLIGILVANAAAGETLKLRYGQAYSSAHTVFFRCRSQ
jgi:hypothetical protein